MSGRARLDRDTMPDRADPMQRSTLFAPAYARTPPSSARRSPGLADLLQELDVPEDRAADAAALLNAPLDRRAVVDAAEEARDRGLVCGRREARERARGQARAVVRVVRAGHVAEEVRQHHRRSAR